MEQVPGVETEGCLTLENYLKDFPEEKIAGLAIATSVYVTQFSYPPFDEPWYIEDENGGRKLEDPAEIYKTISGLLSSPQDILVERGEMGEIIQKKYGGNQFKITTQYPFGKILEVYSRDIMDPESVVLVKYTDCDGNEKLVNLSGNELIDSVTKITAVARYRNISKEKLVKEEIEKEIDYYFDTEKGLSDILRNVDQTSTVYLGEIADLSKKGFMLESLSFTKGHFIGRFPEQIIYLTMPGSSIVKDAERFGQSVVKIVLKMIYGNKYNIEESKFEYKNPNLGDIILYIYKPKIKNNDKKE